MADYTESGGQTENLEPEWEAYANSANEKYQFDQASWELLTRDPEQVAMDTSQCIPLYIEFRGPKTGGTVGDTEVISFPATLESFSDEHKPSVEYKRGYGTGIAATSTGVERKISLKYKLAGYSLEECISNLYLVDRMIQWMYPRDYSPSPDMAAMNSYLNSHAYNPEAPIIGMRLRNLVSIHHGEVQLASAKKSRKKHVGDHWLNTDVSQLTSIGDFMTVVIDSFKAEPIMDAGFVVIQSSMIPKAHDISVAVTVLFDRQYAFNPKRSIFTGGLRYPYGADKQSTVRGELMKQKSELDRQRNEALELSRSANAAEILQNDLLKTKMAADRNEKLWGND